MGEARSYEVIGFSVWPHTNKHSDEPFHLLERGRKWVHSFKNGRSYRYKDSFRDRHSDFSEIVTDTVCRACYCPAFDEPALLVPIPRSGRSERSFDAQGEEYPCRVLARALADGLPGEHTAVELFQRRSPLPPSSLGKRHSLADHVRSLALALPPGDGRPIVLIDDLITKGTQSMACAVMLREAGFTGTLYGFYVGQAVHPSPSMLQQQPYLVHRIRYRSGDEYPRRTEQEWWRDCPQAMLRIHDGAEPSP